MNLKDRNQVAIWLQSGASLREVEQTSPFGLVQNLRFTERARRTYRLIWTWSTHRTTTTSCMGWRGCAAVRRVFLTWPVGWGPIPLTGV